MILTGALVNGGAIVVGGLLGTFGGKLMPEKMRQTVLGATALVSMGIGISGAIGSSNQLIPILSLVIGAVIGELLHIDDGVTRAGDWLQKKFGKMGPITDGFVSGSLVFAVGAMAVMGSLDSGLKNDHSILLAKSVIDFAGSVAFASSMGIGIVFSGLSVLAVEGVMTLLASLLRERPESSVLVFSRTKHGADKLAKILNRAGIKSGAIHGNKSQNARVKAMNDFKTGECRVLIATDIAARGIDISQLPLVINYELPEVAETYVHRIGRTGRAGYEGAAWSFCSEDEFEYLCDIQKLTGLTIPTEGPVPEYAVRKAVPARKPAQKAPQRPARTQEPKPARNAGAKSAQRSGRDAGAEQQRPARNTEQKAARNAAKEPQPAQNPAQADAGHSSRPSRSRRRRGTRPAPGTPIEPAGKTASRPADTSHGQSPKQGTGNASKTAGNKSAAGAAPKSAANPDPGPSAKPSRRRKRGGSGNAARSAAAPAAKSAPAAAEAPQKKWWKRWL